MSPSTVKAIVKTLIAAGNRESVLALAEMSHLIKGRDLVVGDIIKCHGTRAIVQVIEIDGNIVVTDETTRTYNRFYLDKSDTIIVYRA